MFGSAYFPIFDGRHYFPNRAVLSSRPRWPRLLDDEFSFQRNLGTIRPRPLGGIRGWAAEPDVCEIRRSLLVSPPSKAQALEKLVVQFFRFYADGSGAAQFSIGAPALLWSHLRSAANRTDLFLADFLNCHIQSRHITELACVKDAGHMLSYLYGTGITKGNSRQADLRRVWYGSPALFVSISEFSPYEMIGINHSIMQGEIDGSRFAISYRFDKTSLTNANPTFYIFADPGAGRNKMRAVRIIAARLYLELFAFERCLSILTGPDAANLDEMGKSRLATRLNIAASRLAGGDQPRFLIKNGLYPIMSNIFSTLHRPGKVDELLSALQWLSSSANFQSNVLRAINGQFDQERDNATQGGPLYEEAKVTIKYANFGQVGAMGDGARAEHFSQLWQAQQANIDLREASVELVKLQDAMRSEAKEDGHYQSIASVVEAKNAATAGEGASMMAALGKAGKWALSVAEKIGVGVAAGAIKTAIGA